MAHREKRKIKTFDFNMPTGHVLEAKLVNTCAEFYKSQSKNGLVETSVFRYATQEEDKFFGTDAFFYGLPVDFTCNFSGKNHMEDLQVSVELPKIGKIKFGVRTGNGKIRFDMPVLVIGVETNDGYLAKSAIGRVTCAVRAQLQKIIDVGTNNYWEYCDANGY